MKTGFQVIGTLILNVKRADGSIVERRQLNLVVNYGLIGLATVIAGGSVFAPMDHLALGDSSTSPALGDTALGNQLRIDEATVTQLASPEDNKVQFQVEHALGAVVGTFREAGLFDAASSGNMFNRTVFADLTVTSGETLTTTWLVEVRNA